MDILNWFYLKKEQLIRTKANNAKTDLVVLGAEVPFSQRSDGYQTYGMTLADAVKAGDAANTGYYTVDYASTYAVTVTTPKGVIEVTLNTSNLNPLPAFGSSIPLVILNPDMDFTNPDNIYQQITAYYNPDLDDTFIPYVIPTGFSLGGSDIAVLNANPNLAGVNQFSGKFYIYYELYNF